jgi:GNAT superfamily N-acetyltransferase
VQPPASLRPARESDVPVVAGIWYEAWLDGHLGNVPDDLVRIRTPESFQTRTAPRVAETTVADTGSGLAGFIMVHDDEVEQVFVAAAHRGSGIATLLLAEAERQIAAQGHEVAWLAVVPGNARARRFYERQGWADEGPFDYPARLESGGIIPVLCHRYTKPLTSKAEGNISSSR